MSRRSLVLHAHTLVCGGWPLSTSPHLLIVTECIERNARPRSRDVPRFAPSAYIWCFRQSGLRPKTTLHFIHWILSSLVLKQKNKTQRKVRLAQAFWPGARGNVSMVCMTFAGTVERLCNSSVKPFTSSGLGSSPVTWDRGWWHSALNTWRKQGRNMGNVGKCFKSHGGVHHHFTDIDWSDWRRKPWFFLANWSILGPVVIHVMKGWHLRTHRSWGKYHWRILWEALWSFNIAMEYTEWTLTFIHVQWHC